MYDGQGIFPSKNNYQKFLDMGVDEANEIETEALKKKIKEVKFDLWFYHYVMFYLYILKS